MSSFGVIGILFCQCGCFGPCSLSHELVLTVVLVARQRTAIQFTGSTDRHAIVDYCKSLSICTSC